LLWPRTGQGPRSFAPDVAAHDGLPNRAGRPSPSRFRSLLSSLGRSPRGTCL